MWREGAVHHGIELRFDGEGHRIPLTDLTNGCSIMIYPQHEVLKDLIAARLEQGGFLAPRGPVDDVLDTVVNNLIDAANLNVTAQCRVLLTTPIETFSIGHTIVISRGLIDVLPDEASLALVLAANYSYTRQIFVSRAGPSFVFARMLQDGIVMRLLEDSFSASSSVSAQITQTATIT